ncbi:site-specific integrase [Halomonas eurihalina]|uniref:Site-specific integrase n=1 Tax=Halomonas eurihalina TaxID=42566 RepID=A0A5D9D909_HALER|nr:site-specific integrase [Halomonas eurihalina]MDR5859447.1 site-specific integrase [Halomonas eurihalina]TZG40518.1 site-specific integrase [Halomonas eurihalina]
MATFQKRGDSWRAIVRKKGHPAQSKTFSTKSRAKAWAKSIESDIEEAVSGGNTSLGSFTLGELLDLHMVHLDRISSRGRKNLAGDRTLRKGLGEETLLSELSYAKLADFCTSRIEVDGVSAATVKSDIMHLSGAITTGTVEAELPTTLKQTMTTWREGLRRAGLIGSPQSRDRRPTDKELGDLLTHTKHNKALRRIRYNDLIRFAVASCMRLDEICSLRWEDVNYEAGTVIIRLRKHPRQKTDQEVPLMGESQAILEGQPRTDDRIFPYGSESVSNGFRRICRHLEIDDLHFHDLRHEGISRLFERGYQIQEVALVSGHKDWGSLRRYVNLKAGDLARKDRDR